MRPSERIDQSTDLDAIRHVRFHVGPHKADTTDVSLNELATLFELVGNMHEQLQGGRHLREQKYRAKVQITDAVIAGILNQLQFHPPDDGKE